MGARTVLCGGAQHGFVLLIERRRPFGKGEADLGRLLRAGGACLGRQAQRHRESALELPEEVEAVAVLKGAVVDARDLAEAARELADGQSAVPCELDVDESKRLDAGGSRKH